MGTTSFVDILLYLKKHVRAIIAFMIVGAIAGFTVAEITQSYTASVGIQYTYDGAVEQLNPLGGALDVYEVMKPALISAALKEIDSDLSIEQVRNKLSVSPVVKTTDTEAQAAKIALGETVDVTTTNYNVSYTCDGDLGSEFAQRFLYALLKQYDDYFSQQYLQMVRIKDFMSVVDIDGMDYMEKCSYINGQLDEIVSQLDRLVNRDASFTSMSTGLDFAALRAFYFNLRTNQYDRLYANVRIGLLTKNKSLLLQGYEKHIEDMNLQRQNNIDESDQSHELMLEFYEQYKKNNLYYQARATQLETDNNGNNNDNKNLVYDYDLSLMINTYDDILLRYVNTGVYATNFQHDIEHYQTLIDAFANDTASPASKATLYQRADALLAEIRQVSSDYAVLANETLNDYYGAKIADDLKYMMAVEVTPGVSVVVYIGIGIFIAMLLGCAIVIIVEVVSAQLTRKKFEMLQTNEDGTLSADLIENMTPLERAFYEQSTNGYNEFYLMFQPMVCNGVWEISETLVRWESKRHGQVLPDEFIPIAEKYKLMNQLGEWILTEACKQSNAWLSDGKASPCISVNYSTSQIESQSFIDTICRIMTQAKVIPGNIYLEISGGGELHNVDQVAQKFVALKALGLRLTIDRFGDSISSMRTLYDLPADMVKLDRRFLSALRDTHDKNTAFLNQVISVCKERNLQICMCGVEEPWQVERLQNMGVEYQQGFYFSSPLPMEAYEKRYAAYSVKPVSADAVEEEPVAASEEEPPVTPEEEPPVTPEETMEDENNAE